MFTEATKRLLGGAKTAGPRLVSVEGRAGLDALPLVLTATEGQRRGVFHSPGLTDRENGEAFATLIRPFLPDEDPAPSGWAEAMDAVARRAPMTLIIQGPRSLAAANRRIWRTLGEAWTRIRRSGARVHVYLVDDQFGLADALNAEDSPFRDRAAQLRPGPEPDPVETVRIGPGSHYDLGVAAPLWTGMELLVGWALLGGIPSHWGGSPGRASPLRTARERLMPGMPGACPLDGSLPDHLLARHVQSPHRYASILRAISMGATNWREVSATVGAASTAKSSSGPYLQRLQELGMIAVDRSLGARSGSRRSRYRLTDPYEAFWWSRVHPRRSALAVAADPAAFWREQIQPGVAEHVARVLPQVLCGFLLRGAEDYVGSAAREVGPLWGDGFDFPAAATLTNGAVCYTHIHPGPGPASVAALAGLESQMKAARYGFGRQARLRLLVSLSGFTEPLKRESARNPLIRLLDAERLTAPPSGP